MLCTAVYSIQLQQYNTMYGVWPNENKAVEMGVCVADRGFKRNLTQLTGRYD